MLDSLSTALFRETKGTGFFRVLAGKHAVFYVDVLNDLEIASAERPDGMSREDALAIISASLENHPGLTWEVGDDEEIDALQAPELRDKARAILEYLLKCRWLEEPPRRDWRRMIFFDAHGSTLLAALRKIAWPDVAVFTDKITGVCAMLANEGELADRPWETIEHCLAAVREGLNELRAMQKSVQRYTRRQMEEDTLHGNLSVVFDDYSEKISHSCYAALVRARLPLRLPEAVRRIHERLFVDSGALATMQTEVMRRNPDMSADTARAKVIAALDDLTESLERVLPMADEIDKRTADFTRRSLARFRYLQDVTGERRTELRELFIHVNHLVAGRRLTHLSGSLPDFPEMIVPAVKIPCGLDSLHTPPTRRTPVEQHAFDDSLTETDKASGLHDMEKALREALSVQRANGFLQGLPGGKGHRIESSDLTVEGERGLTDLISLLLHAESPEARYRIESMRVSDENSPPPVDCLTDCAVERFSIVKK